jgi:hypothetical protein
MKTKTILLSALLIFSIPFASNAQLGGLIRNKAAKVLNAGAKTVNKEVDNKIDSAATKKTQEQLDKAKQNAEQNAAQSNQQTEQSGQSNENQSTAGQSKGFNLGGLMGGKVTSKYDPSYSFASRIYMQMEMYDKKDKVTKMDYFIYFSANSTTAGIETKIVGTSEEGGQVAVNSSMVMDGPNKSFIMLTEVNNMKMGMISQIPDETTAQTQASDKPVKPPVITKTGNSKTIAGYKCDEYTYRDDQNKKHGTMWATKDLKLSADRRAFSKSGMPSYYGNTDLENSAVLAMEQYNDKNELELKSDTKEINLNYSHTISTAGFTLRQMNFNQAGQKGK